MRRPARTLLVGGGILFVFTGIIIFGPFHYQWWKICSRCGMQRHGVDYQVPYLAITCYTARRDVPTPLSRFLTRSKLVDAHQHQWLFGNGYGNGIRCALGKGRLLYANSQTPCVAAFLCMLHTYRDPATTRKWVRFVLTPSIDSRETSRYLEEAGFPETGFTAKQDFDRWWAEHGQAIEQQMVEHSE